MMNMQVKGTYCVKLNFPYLYRFYNRRYDGIHTDSKGIITCLVIYWLTCLLLGLFTCHNTSLYPSELLYINIITRIKATRCETLMTFTTNNSKKHSHLTYCLNVSLMIQTWTATIFSTSESILLMVHENILFWFVTTNI